MADEPRYGTIDEQGARRLGSTPSDADEPIWTFHLLQRLDPHAPMDPPAPPDAEVVFVGEVQDQLLNDSPRWDHVVVVRHRSRRSLGAVPSQPTVLGAHLGDGGGVEQAVVIAATPFPSPETAADRATATPWDQVPHPPTPEDGYAQVIHVLRFEDEGVGEDVGDGGGTPGEMDEYTKHATRVAVAQGVRIGGWFKAEATLVHDGRPWHQVRFNTFPSRAAFLAVALDPDRLAAQAQHREKALADTYTLVVRPTFDRLNDPDLVAFARTHASASGTDA